MNLLCVLSEHFSFRRITSTSVDQPPVNHSRCLGSLSVGFLEVERCGRSSSDI